LFQIEQNRGFDAILTPQRFFKIDKLLISNNLVLLGIQRIDPNAVTQNSKGFQAIETFFSFYQSHQNFQIKLPKRLLFIKDYFVNYQVVFQELRIYQ